MVFHTQDTLRIREAVAKAGVKTVTSFVLRWNPQFETLRQLIDDGVLGDLIYGEADYWHPAKRSDPNSPYRRRRWSAAPLFPAAVMLWTCCAIWAAKSPKCRPLPARPKLNLAYDYPPVAVAIVKFANGAVGKLSAVTEGDSPYGFHCRLFGDQRHDPGQSRLLLAQLPRRHRLLTIPTITPNSGDVSHHPFKAEIAHFIECLDDDVESHASIYDSCRSMAVCFAIDESATLGGQPVIVAYD